MSRKRRSLLASDDPAGTIPAAVASFVCQVLASISPRKLKIRVVGVGFGANRDPEGQWFVSNSDASLGTAKKTLGGARVHWHKSPSGDFDHAERFGPAKKASEWLGTDHDVGYIADLAASDDGLTATLYLDDDVPEEVAASLADKRVGFSVECMAARRPAIREGRKVAELVDFAHFPDRQASVAIVSHPALRGEVLSLAASRARPVAAARSTPMTIEQARALLASSTATQDEKDRAQTVVERHEAAEHAAAMKVAREGIEKELLASRKANAARDLAATIAEAKLPEESAATVRELFASTIEKGETPKPEDVTKAIDRERKKLSASAGRTGSLDVQVGAGGVEKLGLAFERLLMGMNPPEYAAKRYAELSPTAKGQLLASREQAAGIGLSNRAYSFNRTMREFVGIDVADLLRMRGRERRELKGSITLSQFGDVFENVLNIVGTAYQENPRYNRWREIVSIVPISGTLKQERVAVGGYGNLPVVGETDNYPAATSPGDQGHGYTPTKRGYTEDWTIESMLNDRIGALADIVRKMATAADRTKHDYVMDQLTILGMPTMDYDSTALFHADHGGNLLSSALTATSLAAARLVMLKQTDLGNSKRLSLTPKFLLVRDDLYETAWTLLVGQLPPGSTATVQYVRSMNLEIIPVTPTENGWDTVADWVLCADPNNGLVKTFEVGFEGGREMAEIHVQDMQNAGSVFERDTVTVAIKQPYMGGSPLRDEGFVISDV